MWKVCTAWWTGVTKHRFHWIKMQSNLNESWNEQISRLQPCDNDGRKFTTQLARWQSDLHSDHLKSVFTPLFMSESVGQVVDFPFGLVSHNKISKETKMYTQKTCGSCYSLVIKSWEVGRWRKKVCFLEAVERLQHLAIKDLK